MADIIGSFLLPDDFNKIKFKYITDKFEGQLDRQTNPGLRCIVVLTVDRVSSSCGYSIPQFVYDCERPTLDEFSKSKGCDGMIEYRALKNSFSIDGLPSIGQVTYFANMLVVSLVTFITTS